MSKTISDQFPTDGHAIQATWQYRFLIIPKVTKLRFENRSLGTHELPVNISIMQYQHT